MAFTDRSARACSGIARCVEVCIDAGLAEFVVVLMREYDSDAKSVVNRNDHQNQLNERWSQVLERGSVQDCLQLDLALTSTSVLFLFATPASIAFDFTEREMPGLPFSIIQFLKETETRQFALSADLKSIRWRQLGEVAPLSSEKHCSFRMGYGWDTVSFRQRLHLAAHR